MSILSVEKYCVRPERVATWEQGLTRVAAKAREKQHPLTWRCSQVIGGEMGVFYLGHSNESVAEVAAREGAAELLAALFGESQGERVFVELGASLSSIQSMILRDRPELSYPSDEQTELPVASVVTQAIVRPGHVEACEELFRKVAEAIPKTGDARRFTTYQPLIGNLRLIAAVRPIFDLQELDEATPIPQLLREAFGAAESSLIYRVGLEAIENIESQLLLSRPEMSNLAS